MFMQMSLIKQDIHVDNNRDALKRSKNKGGCLAGMKFFHKILFQFPMLTVSLWNTSQESAGSCRELRLGISMPRSVILAPQSTRHSPLRLTSLTWRHWPSKDLWEWSEMIITFLKPSPTSAVTEKKGIRNRVPDHSSGAQRRAHFRFIPSTGGAPILNPVPTHFH